MTEVQKAARASGHRDMTVGPIGRTLLAFALPTLASSILQSLNGSINAIWIGRFLGEEALASTVTGNMLMFLMIAFVFGFAMAATVLVGQAFGAGNVDQARRVIGTAVGSIIPLAILISVLGWLYAPWLIDVLALAPQAAPLALAYLRVIFLAIPPMMLLGLLIMGIRGAGDAMTPLWFMILAVFLDAGLNPVFILGLGPMPALGIAGSALATVIANLVTLASFLLYSYARDVPLRLRGRELLYLIPDPALLRAMVTKGVPMGLQVIVVSSAALATMGLVNREGVDTAAAFGAAMQLWNFVQMPAMALAAAVSAMAAQNIGAGKWDRVSAATRAGIAQNFLITGALVLLIALFDRPLLALFLGGNSPALPIAEHIQLLASWSFLLLGVTMILFGTMRSNGAVIGPLVILFIGLYPFRLGFAVGAYSWLGADALWLSFPVGSLANVVLAIAFYLHGGWRRARMMPTPISVDEAIEEAEGLAEPGGRINPAG